MRDVKQTITKFHALKIKVAMLKLKNKCASLEDKWERNEQNWRSSGRTKLYFHDKKVFSLKEGIKQNMFLVDIPFIPHLRGYFPMNLIF